MPLLKTEEDPDHHLATQAVFVVIFIPVRASLLRYFVPRPCPQQSTALCLMKGPTRD